MVHKTQTKDARGEWIEFIYHLQDKICQGTRRSGWESFVFGR